MKIIFKNSTLHGKGIFATATISKHEILETCPLLLLTKEDTAIIDKTDLYNYYFAWNENNYAISLGFGSIYNHSYTPNAIYEKDFENNVIVFKAIQDIKELEEITINYNGNPQDKSPVWFEQTNINSI
jgi:uncharacterized protein